MTAWIIRGGTSGTNGELEEEFLENEWVAISYDLFEDLSNVRTKEDLKSLLQRTKKESDARSIPSWTTRIWDFIHSIDIGDLVVMPRKGKRIVAIGEMTGEYQYRPEGSMLPHCRVVRWINREVSRDLLEPDLEASINAQGTVYQPTPERAEEQLRAIADRHGTAALWDEFVRRAKEYVNSGRLETEELDYKREMGRELAASRSAVLAGAANWRDLLKRALRSRSGHPIAWTLLNDFHSWCDGKPEAALDALQSLWSENDLSYPERINSFMSILPDSALRGAVGNSTNVISVLLMGLDVARYPPFRVTLFNAAYERTGYDRPERDADEAAVYEHALGFLDRFIEEAAKRGLELRHRLDAQSVVWGMPQNGSDDPPPPPEPTDLEALAEDVFLPVEFLEEIETLLKEKKQVIFQGPPGTGKTFVAQKLAACLAGSDERVTLVQFHPSYAYEDFIQGFRPKTTDGQAGFELRSGPLLQAAERARKEPYANHYLVIDEINRGNVAKVFGELYFLLEYRDSEMNLQYSDEPFSLPGNLYIIGTMNTADRSIALVDMALRRRFYFKMFHPDDEPIKSVLRKWIAQNAAGMEWVADVVERTNELLKDDRHAAIGPSYFMTPGLNEAAVRRIWEHSVLPYLEERRFGGDDVAEEFDLDKLRRAGGPAVSQEDGDEEAGSAAGHQADDVSNASA